MELFYIYVGGLIACAGSLYGIAPPETRSDKFEWVVFSLFWPIALTYVLMQHFLWGNNG